MKKSKFRETVESIGIALLVALIFRSFLMEPYKIPSSSMVPTLLIGDHIFVNKFVYGLRIPFTKIRVWNGRDPQRGEVAIFMFPQNERQDYIKRVVGLPGDRIRIKQDKIYVNDQLQPQTSITWSPDPEHKNQILLNPVQPYQRMSLFNGWESYEYVQEKLDEHPHLAQYQFHATPEFEVAVPEGQYFFMGDNRDESYDSRAWGFVPRENIEGRAMFIWISLDWGAWQWNHLLDSIQNIVRWHRFSRWIY